MNSNIIFQTLNELERVDLLVTELKHHIFGLERSNIELRTSNRAFTRFTKLLIEQTRTDSNTVFSNMEQIRMCQSFSNRTRTPYLLTLNNPTLNFEHSLTHHY